LATYYFSSFEDGDAAAFDPRADVFLFDNWFLAPGSVAVLSQRASVVLKADNRRVTLTGVTVDQLNASNVSFAAYNIAEPVSAVAAVTGPAAADSGYEMSIA
jgi:hypothetical protein